MISNDIYLSCFSTLSITVCAEKYHYRDSKEDNSSCRRRGGMPTQSDGLVPPYARPLVSLLFLGALAVPSFGATFQMGALIQVGFASGAEISAGASTASPASTVDGAAWASGQSRLVQVEYLKSTNTEEVRLYNGATTSSGFTEADLNRLREGVQSRLTPSGRFLLRVLRHRHHRPGLSDLDEPLRHHHYRGFWCGEHPPADSADHDDGGPRLFGSHHHHDAIAGHRFPGRLYR